MTWMNDPRRNREVLVTVSFAGSQFGCGRHQGSAASFDSGSSALRTRGDVAHANAWRIPHIGEYAHKTNAFCGPAADHVKPMLTVAQDRNRSVWLDRRRLARQANVKSKTQLNTASCGRSY
jgi:hypothetical protein